MPSKRITIYCDGGSRGNPGPAASAFAVIKNGETIFKDSMFLGRSTNNIAEYQSTLMAIEWLLKNKTSQDTVAIVVDSQLVFKQMTGQYKIKNERIKIMATKIKTLEKKLKTKVKYQWSPRSKNKIADRLVNEELDKNNKFSKI